jgi:hypothetical protein
MTEPALQPRGVRGVASKLHEYHLQRLAIVSVRQAHPQQVVEHVESTARPYALVDRAVALGWSRDRVVVLDEDQGQSGQRMVTRLGFQRVLAEVSLDPCRADPGAGDESLGALKQGLASMTRTLCDLSDVVGRCRRSL